MVTCLFILLSLSACGTMQDAMIAVQDAGVDPVFTGAGTSKRLIAADTCPEVEVVEDLAMVHDFVPGMERLPTTLITRADIVNAVATCDSGPQNVSTTTQIDFTAMNGAASAKPLMPINKNYFVAVTSENGLILAKQVFPVSIQYDATLNRYTATDRIKQVIPTDKYHTGSKYKVLIGFQINDVDLKFNRNLLAAQKHAQVQQQVEPLPVPPIAEAQETQSTPLGPIIISSETPEMLNAPNNESVTFLPLNTPVETNEATP